MKKIISDKLSRIIKNKKRLEAKLNIKIENRGKEIYIHGKAEEEYIAEKVIDALNLGFKYSKAILIKENDFMFEILNIKNYTKRHDLKRIRARIIGKKGKTKKTIEELTGCFLELRVNDVGIIGPSENIQNAQNAIISIVQGTRQGNVYAFLEKHQVKEEVDLGLKEGFK